MGKINMKLPSLIHIRIGIVCMGLLPGLHAVVPAADGEYSGGEMAESEDALFSPAANSGNTATGPVAEFVASSSAQAKSATASFNTRS